MLCIAWKCAVCMQPTCIKLTWLVLGGDPVVCSHGVEQYLVPRMVEEVDGAKLITLPFLTSAMSGPLLESFPSSIIALCFIGA